MTVRAARRIPNLQPGTGEWLSMMTASKVAAVLGLSPWESRYSLYYRLAGQLPHKTGTVNTERGHYLEDAIAHWFADQRTDLRIGKTGSWVNKARPWQSATPDRLTWQGRRATGVLEIKTSGEYEGWGRDGTDEIPPYYRTQVVWQMDCLGLPVAHVAVLLPRLAFRAYTIAYDPGEAEWIRDQVTDFLATLPGGANEQAPDIDADDATYQAIRRMHPEIEDREAELPPDLGRRLLDAVDTAKAADSAATGAKSEVAQLMGTAKAAVVVLEGGERITVATRTAKGAGTPYVAPTRAQQARDLLGIYERGTPMPDIQPRPTSQADYFPYASKVVCYFEVAGGQLTPISHYKDDRCAAIQRARRRRKPSLFAVWPGQYRSDLFVVDDLDAMAAAV